MTSIRLILRDANGDELAALQSHDRRIQIIRAVPSMQASLGQWIREGLREWVGPLQDRVPRLTRSTEPGFLERLAQYLARNTTLHTSIERSDTITARMGLRTLSASGAASLSFHRQFLRAHSPRVEINAIQSWAG
jgi:hypothetical protein